MKNQHSGELTTQLHLHLHTLKPQPHSKASPQEATEENQRPKTTRRDTYSKGRRRTLLIVGNGMVNLRPHFYSTALQLLFIRQYRSATPLLEQRQTKPICELYDRLVDIKRIDQLRNHKLNETLTTSNYNGGRESETHYRIETTYQKKQGLQTL